MGNQNSNQLPNQEFTQRFDITNKNKQANVLFLFEKITSKQFALKEIIYTDKSNADKFTKTLQEKKSIFQNPHLVTLSQYKLTQQDQFCATYHKFNILYQYPHRNLDQWISQRTLQQNKFAEEQIWSILASCIIGLSHLQKNKIIHQSLSSQEILLQKDGIVKIADPFIMDLDNNFTKLQTKRKVSHLYVSPELCKILYNHQHSLFNINLIKSDVFTLGMIMLQAIFLKYQDFCYKNDYTQILTEAIEKQISQIGQTFTKELYMIIKLMLQINPDIRPDWNELETLVVKKGDGINIRESSQQIGDIIPLKPNSNEIKPKAGMVPSDIYITHTKFDQNLIEVSDEQDSIIKKNNINNIFQTSEVRSNNMASSQGIKIFTVDNKDGNKLLQNPVYQGKGKTNLNPITLGQGSNKNLINTNQQNRDIHHIGIPQTNTIHGYLQGNISYQPQGFIKQNYPTQIISNNKAIQSIIIPPSIKLNQRPPTYYIPPPSLQPIYNTILPNSNNVQNVSFLPQYMNAPRNQSTQKTRNLNQSNNYKVDDNLFTDFSKLGIVKPNYNNNNSIRMGYQDPKNQTLPSPWESKIQVKHSIDIKPTYVIQNFTQGSRYQGEKVNGMRHGQGKFYYQDGGLYQGQWKQNKMWGKGRLYYQSGKLAYDGNWENDKFSGFGILYHQNPKPLDGEFDYKNFDELEDHWIRFEGYFVNDLKDGNGKLFLTNDQYFQGEFKGDEINGNGIFIRKDKSQIKGIWRQNALNIIT